MEILFDEIPSLDLADFTAGNPEKKAEFVRKLGEAYQNIGFVAIKNHGLSKELQDRLYSSITTFFTLPDAVKSQYEKPEIGYQRGYTGKGKEHAKGRNTGDLKEFYHIGQDLAGIPDTDPIKSEYPANCWPQEIPQFKEDALEAYRTLENAGRQMLRAIALNLGLEEAYFEDKVIPFKTEAERIGYTEAQLDWARANESYIWRYFIERELLFSTDSKLPGRFINLAPFSKFYLEEIDSQSPGRLGQYMGWQIVRAYMENNEVTLKDMLLASSEDIFNNSKFKPRK